jgi:hypothetical protein
MLSDSHRIISFPCSGGHLLTSILDLEVLDFLIFETSRFFNYSEYYYVIVFCWKYW